MSAARVFRESAIRRIAIHEAGHAVAHWWLDRRRFLGRHYCFPYLSHVAVARATDDILTGGQGNARPDLGGVCAGDPLVNPVVERAVLELEPQLQTEARRQFICKAAMADCIHVMAGPIAENLALGDPIGCCIEWENDQFDDALQFESEEGHDHWQVEQRVPFLGRRWRLHLERAFSLADDIVRQHQPHIEALVAALVQHGTIDGEEVYRLFDEAGAPAGIGLRP